MDSPDSKLANFGGDIYPSSNIFQRMTKIFSTFHQSCLVMAIPLQDVWLWLHTDNTDPPLV